MIAGLQASPLPFATVIAPAGYGKTTLLAGWAEMDPRPFAWVSLDGLDDDDVLFLRYIAAAMHRVQPVAPEVFAALAGPGASIWPTGIPRVGSALAALERPMVLVLDDQEADGLLRGAGMELDAGARSQSHGLDQAVAAGPDRARRWPWMTLLVARCRRRRRPSTVVSWASSTRSTRPSIGRSRPPPRPASTWS